MHPHPRPFLRTSSKCQLIPSCDYDDKGTPQHVVIGFHLVSEDSKHQPDSPRSVLESSALCPSNNPEHLRSPRSPRSVLGCLFSGQESHRPFREGVGLGVVAAITAEESCVSKSLHNSPTTSKPIAISVQNENVGVHKRNVCEESFVEETQTFYSGVMRDDDFDDDDFDDDDDDDVEEDLVTGMHESIFCATSPFSTCCSLEYPTRDFLSVCFFCKCNLSHGKDVYMYKGDKAFCSLECRYQQIVIDEFKERQLASANCYAGTSTQNVNMFAGASAAVA